jgi:hypothetical protein
LSICWTNRLNKCVQTLLLFFFFLNWIYLLQFKITNSCDARWKRQSTESGKRAGTPRGTISGLRKTRGLLNCKCRRSRPRTKTPRAKRTGSLEWMTLDRIRRLRVTTKMILLNFPVCRFHQLGNENRILILIMNLSTLVHVFQFLLLFVDFLICCF